MVRRIWLPVDVGVLVILYTIMIIVYCQGERLGEVGLDNFKALMLTNVNAER